MKAAQINGYGGNEVWEVNPNAPKPSLRENQVLVEVYAASLNPFDLAIRSGALKDKIPLSFPVTLGGDFSGVVREVGRGVANFKPGDEVYGQALVLKGNSGSFAEFASVNVDTVAMKPKTIDFIEAAALPLVGVSAIQALEEHIKLKSGQKILIHGGAGGIGHVAIQLAKALGAFVATTASGDGVEFVKQLGADQVINYKQSLRSSASPAGLRSEKFEEILKDFDAVFDTVGGQTTGKSFQVLKKGGVLVSMLGQPSQELTEKYGVVAIGQGTKVETARLDRLAQLVDSGKVKVKVDKIFPLEQIKEASEYFEKGHPRGKVVLQIRVEAKT